MGVGEYSPTPLESLDYGYNRLEWEIARVMYCSVYCSILYINCYVYCNGLWPVLYTVLYNDNFYNLHPKASAASGGPETDGGRQDRGEAEGGRQRDCAQCAAED